MKIEIDDDLLLVFFDWLSRQDDKEKLIFENESERIAAWKFLGVMEKALTATFDVDYRTQIQKAQEKISSL